MKKSSYYIVFFMLLSIFACKQNTYNENDGEYKNVLSENQIFMNNINYLRFDYSENEKKFYYKRNDVEFSFLISDIKFEKDSVLKIPYLVKNINCSEGYKGEVYKQLSILKSGGILLSFDDYYSAWIDALNYFDKYNLKATWFCKGGGC